MGRCGRKVGKTLQAHFGGKAVLQAELMYVPKPVGGARGGGGCLQRAHYVFPKKKTLSPCKIGGAHKWAEMLHHPRILGDPQREGDKIKMGGAHKWAEMLHHPCILGDPQREGDKIKIGGAHKWAIMLHHQGGQNQNWMPKPCLLGGPQVGRNPAFSVVPSKENKVKTKKKPKKKLSHGIPGPAYGPAD